MTMVLFIGAHPDDLELGAGGTIAKFCLAGHHVSTWVLTAEPDEMKRATRKKEAAAALKVLGVKQENILFFDYPDGSLEANATSVARMREAVGASGFDPTVVVTHSEADSHNDHVAANQLVLATFRKKVILHFPVVNSLVVSEFKPRFFVDISNQRQLKDQALKYHNSQEERGRIQWNEWERVQSEWGKAAGFEFAESFEVTVESGAEGALLEVMQLSDCAFHRFWLPILDNQELMNIHGEPVFRQRKESDWPSDKDREGMSRLRRAFETMWPGRSPINEYSSGTSGVEQLLDKDVILSGGAVSNVITRTYFNHLQGIRYVIDYDMPDYRNIRIFDKLNNAKILADYMPDNFGCKIVRRDRAILTVMRNPKANGTFLIGCMGIHGYGGLACYKVLSGEGGYLGQFIEKCVVPIPDGIQGYQIILSYDTRLEEVAFLWETLYDIPIANDFI